MKWRREAFLDLLSFRGTPGRPMFVELFGPLVGLEDEWLAQGASPDEIDLTAFDFDSVPRVGCGGNMGLRGDTRPTVLEETEDWRIERDGLGRTVKLYKRAATIAHPLDYPVRDVDSWLAIKPRYAFAEERVDPDAVEVARAARGEGAVVVAHLPGAFDTPRGLMGEERACLAYYEQPGLVRDILETLAETAVRVLEQVAERVTVDVLAVHEDFAGKSGPLAGPKQVREFWRPYYRRAWEAARAAGARLFSLDSDGNLDAVLEPLVECGVNVAYPMEPAAGMDIVEVRRRFGRRLAVMGGIDKFVLQRGREAVRAELEYKMQPIMREGGTVFGLDHRIPNGTPLEAYRSYVDAAREVLGIEPRSPERKGWARMAL